MKRTLFSLMLLIGLMAPATGVMAQPTAADQTYTSQVTGDEVDIGSSGEILWIEENFDYRETISFQEEYIWFTYGWSNFQVVFIDGPNDTETYHNTTMGNMTQFYDSWVLIDEEITDQHSWFLGEAVIAGEPLIVYYVFELDAFGTVDMAFLQFTDISTFQRDLEFIQSEVTISGAPILPNTDATELASLVGYEEATPDPSPEADTEQDSRTTRSSSDSSGDEEKDRSRTTRGGTDVSTEDEPDESDESTSRTSRSTRGGTDPTVGDDGEDANTSETGAGEADRETRGGRLGTDQTTDDSNGDVDDDTSTPASGGAWDEMGLISDTEWESPTYGTSITWDTASWVFPEDFDFAIHINEDPPYDILTLQTTDDLGYVNITVDAEYDLTPRSLVDFWTSDEYADQVANDLTVLETGTTANSASIVYTTTDPLDQPLTVVLEATFTGDGHVVYSQISAAPDTIHDVYAQYVNGVEINGQLLQFTFTVEDIQEITGN